MELTELNLTIGELKAQALMLMGINNALNISSGDIDGLKDDPTYGTYVNGMNGAINRCLSRMYMVDALAKEPKILTNGSDEGDSISVYAKDITASLANLIPLYIVGDVFALDEPSLAQNKRNEFEQALAYNCKNTGEIQLVYECE